MRIRLGGSGSRSAIFQKETPFPPNQHPIKELYWEFCFYTLHRMRHYLNQNTKAGSKKNISVHYDLGNNFFSLWLDKSLTYSSAIFDSDKKDLESAQYNKYLKLINLIKPKSGDRILEIGCGWGGFAEYVGKNLDVKVNNFNQNTIFGEIAA